MGRKFFGQYGDEEMYKLQNTEEMKEIQSRKLQAKLDRTYERSEFFRNYCSSLSINLDKIKTVDDFNNAFPVLRQKTSLAKLMTDNWRDSLRKTIAYISGLPEQDFVILRSTSGTTGEPSPYFWTKQDVRMQTEGLARGFHMVGVEPGDVVTFGLGLSMWGGGSIAESLEDLGIAVIPVGAEGGSAALFKFSKAFGGNILFCTPSYAEHLIEKDPKEVRSLGFKRVICAAEPGAGIPEVRKRIEEGFGCPLTDCMGVFWGIMMISCDLPEYAGMHYLADDLCIISLADPETGKPISFEDGAIGEWIITFIDEQSLGMVRLSVGDLLQVFTEPCKCGNPGWRLKVVGRIDDMLKVKGVIVYPTAIDRVITGFHPRVTGEFRIVLDSPPPRVEPPLKLKVEYGELVKKEELEALTSEIAEEMHSKLKIRPRIEWLPSMTLPRATHKTKFIEKAYEKKNQSQGR
jgi:phenylacetate-CoA ligase